MNIEVEGCGGFESCCWLQYHATEQFAVQLGFQASYSVFRSGFLRTDGITERIPVANESTYDIGPKAGLALPLHQNVALEANYYLGLKDQAPLKRLSQSTHQMQQLAVGLKYRLPGHSNE